MPEERNETNEMFRELRKRQQAWRAHNRARNERQLAGLEERGLIVVALLDRHSGHRRVWNADRSRVAEIWPSTGTVIAGKLRAKGVASLLRALGVRP